jgi:hypothetical protein
MLPRIVVKVRAWAQITKFPSSKTVEQGMRNDMGGVPAASAGQPSKPWSLWLLSLSACLAMMGAPPGAMSQVGKLPPACALEPGRIIRCIKPSETDPSIQRFDSAHYVLVDTISKPGGNLLVYLAGTGLAPPGPVDFLKTAADAGYRVISLAYNDTPSVLAFCQRNPVPGCYDKFHRMRIYGDQTLGDRTDSNTGAESIVNRLAKLLQLLERRDAKGGWGTYLENGNPSWSRIALAGWSQGAGMAAFIAKEHATARVVLFSGPFDSFRPPDGGRQLAAWISKPSETPPALWFGAYHAREDGSDLLASVYSALGIPQDHIRVFQLDLNAKRQGSDLNPFHAEALHNPAYAQQRAFLLGRSP